MKLTFYRKKTPQWVVFQSWKKLQVIEKRFLLKKNASSLFAQIRILTTVCGNVLGINGSQGISLLVIYRSEMLFFIRKLLIITRTTKNQENSVNRLGENYFTNHLAKFLQDSLKPSTVRGAPRASTRYYFSYEIFVGEGFIACFHFSCDLY